MLYKTGVEYGDYTMNHVLGCSHGCKYPCYAYLMKKRFGVVKSYSEWTQPKLVANTLELLDKEIPRLKEKIESVQLCFSTDPFMIGYPKVQEMSLKAIKKLNIEGIKCSILTKGILPKELAHFSKKNMYGISLVSLDEEYREINEPGTAPYAQRLSALHDLHDVGYKTWVSIEPYPTPNIVKQNLDDILEAVRFADQIIFGRTNYCKTVSAYKECKAFYNACAERVMTFCEENGIQCHIKDKTITKV